MNLVQIIAGLATGIIAGMTMWLFKFCKDFKGVIYVKLFVVLAFAVIVPIIWEIIDFPEAKYICIIFFGWMCHVWWKHDKPERELTLVWIFFQPFLFGTVGASVKFDEINGGDIGKGIGIILIGVTARWFITFLVTYKYRTRERVFCAFAWIPKATVQAAIGGIFLFEARKNNLSEEYINWGIQVVTTAVFAIVLTAPTGAILTNTLGPLLLSKAPPPQTLEEAQEEEEHDKKLLDRLLYPLKPDQIKMNFRFDFPDQIEVKKKEDLIIAGERSQKYKDHDAFDEHDPQITENRDVDRHGLIKTMHDHDSPDKSKKDGPPTDDKPDNHI